MNKKRELEPWEYEECMSLKLIVEEHNERSPKKNRITQLEMAEDLNITQGGVSLYLNGKNALNIEIASYFAKKFNVKISDFSKRLQQQHDQMITESVISETSAIYQIDTDKKRKLPLLDFSSACCFEDFIKNGHLSNNYLMIEAPSYAHPRCFWLNVEGDYMTAPAGISVPDGYLILVDPDAIPKNNDLVIAKLKDSKDATFKKLVIDSGVKYLKPLNQAYKTIEIDDNYQIIGIIKEAKLTL